MSTSSDSTNVNIATSNVNLNLNVASNGSFEFRYAYRYTGAVLSIAGILESARLLKVRFKSEQWIYGNLNAVPPAGNQVDCSTFVAWTLYEAGLTELAEPDRLKQKLASNGTLAAWFDHRSDFVKITDEAELTAGDIVFVRWAPEPQYPEHVYLYTEKNFGYDCGNLDFVRSGGIDCVPIGRVQPHQADFSGRVKIRSHAWSPLTLVNNILDSSVTTPITVEGTHEEWKNQLWFADKNEFGNGVVQLLRKGQVNTMALTVRSKNGTLGTIGVNVYDDGTVTTGAPSPLSALDRTRKIATTEWVYQWAAASGGLANYTYNSSGTSYYKLPGGLIIQWGTISRSASVQSGTVGLALPFSAAGSYAVSFTASASGTVPGIQQKTVNSFVWETGSSAAGSISWIAIGS